MQKDLADVAARYGPWIADNIDLGDGVFTIGRDVRGAAEQRVERIARLVSDLARRPLDELEVLDLGALEGGFSVALARRGARVTAVEGREHHAAKIEFAARALDVDVSVVRSDVRAFTLEPDRYDVVLCLGLLYHLPAGRASGRRVRRS